MFKTYKSEGTNQQKIKIKIQSVLEQSFSIICWVFFFSFSFKLHEKALVKKTLTLSLQ